jgi:hypothetical protein
MMADGGEMQRAVRGAIDEITGADERIRVTHAMATRGWGDVLYVDVYAHSLDVTLYQEFDRALWALVARVTNTPIERVTIRWRIST